MMKKRFGKMFAVILCLSFCLSQGLFDGLSMFSSVIEVQAASAAKGIYGNGTGGINIDVNAAPFTTFKNYTMGDHAYKSDGCAWFASARVNQLTGKGNTIWGGPGWYNRGASALGFSKGSSIKAPAVLCWSGHVAILEKSVEIRHISAREEVGLAMEQAPITVTPLYDLCRCPKLRA